MPVLILSLGYGLVVPARCRSRALRLSVVRAWWCTRA
jgi:hypothetical protein